MALPKSPLQSVVTLDLDAVWLILEPAFLTTKWQTSPQGTQQTADVFTGHFVLLKALSYAYILKLTEPEPRLNP